MLLIAYWIMFAMWVCVFVLQLATQRRASYWFDAFLVTTRKLDPATAIRQLEAFPVPGFWRSFMFWKPLA